jgi:hypothetical protein
MSGSNCTPWPPVIIAAASSAECAGRVTRPVPPLVVADRDCGRGLENLVRDPDLAEVMELAREAQELTPLRLEAKPGREKTRRATAARDVASRLFVPKLRCTPKAVDRLFLRGAKPFLRVGKQAHGLSASRPRLRGSRRRLLPSSGAPNRERGFVRTFRVEEIAKRASQLFHRVGLLEVPRSRDTRQAASTVVVAGRGEHL